MCDIAYWHPDAGHLSDYAVQSENTARAYLVR